MYIVYICILQVQRVRLEWLGCQPNLRQTQYHHLLRLLDTRSTQTVILGWYNFELVRRVLVPNSYLQFSIQVGPVQKKVIYEVQSQQKFRVIYHCYYQQASLLIYRNQPSEVNCYGKKETYMKHHGISFFYELVFRHLMHYSQHLVNSSLASFWFHI